MSMDKNGDSRVWIRKNMKESDRQYEIQKDCKYVCCVCINTYTKYLCTTAMISIQCKILILVQSYRPVQLINEDIKSIQFHFA